MVQIDRLCRITLRDLKPFYSRLRELKAEHPTGFRGVLTGTMNFCSEWRHPTITILANVNEYGDIESFVFRWEYDGRERKQKINITSLPSNLIEGVNCPYFVCPQTHRYCRKLYTDGSAFASRYSFPHTYSDRNQSKQGRQLAAVIKAMQDVDEPHPYRKETYRGEITPYGRRMRKNYITLSRYVGVDPLNDVQARADIETRALLTRRGRPGNSR